MSWLVDWRPFSWYYSNSQIPRIHMISQLFSFCVTCFPTCIKVRYFIKAEYLIAPSDMTDWLGIARIKWLFTCVVDLYYSWLRIILNWDEWLLFWLHTCAFRLSKVLWFTLAFVSWSKLNELVFFHVHFWNILFLFLECY